MKFSQAEHGAAAKLHLRLASPYEAVRTQMLRNGWIVDPEWLKDFEAEAKRGLPVCGEGWDAICHIKMSKGKSAVVLTFSGTNRGYPLVAVEPSQ